MDTIEKSTRSDRRTFLHTVGLGSVALGAFSRVEHSLAAEGAANAATIPDAQLGTLFPFIEQTAARSTLELSFLHERFRDVAAWKGEARSKLRELLRYDPPRSEPRVEVVERVDHGDHVRERLSFNTTPDIRVPAFVLVPKGDKKRWPAVVALHDHGGFYLWGKEKIVEAGREHPALTEFKRRSYAGRSWATELCRRGYVVIAIDMMFWGERRMLLAADPQAWRERETLSAQDVTAFNKAARDRIPLLATALFEAGVTWAGVMFTDDLRTVDYLLTRPDVDPDRIGCCGLSVGGFRSAHLAGLDARIKAAVVVGWMSSYGAMLRTKLTSIGPMKFIPGLYRYLDLPDVVAMTAPGGLMVIHGTQDRLFTNEGVREAFDKIGKVYAKAGVPDRFEGVTYDGPHEFNAAMQDRAFAWLDRWLKA
ncbi:MAG: alpha/beta hydrolase family protein [Verrucomicrobiales bacterium]|nr:alpha/beta hydrolase family protein [Verrucomicrobiales bacterium]